MKPLHGQNEIRGLHVRFGNVPAAMLLRIDAIQGEQQSATGG
jgi:hypothetical protein